MDALEALMTRVTVPQAMMDGPGPGGEALARILAAGAAAPDHGKLRPWRFLVIRGDARARLGDVFADALRRKHPDAPEAELDRERAKPLRTPLIVAVVARVDPDHPKIPAVEQASSAAAAAQNMLVAAHAQGFVGKWSTGTVAYDEGVREALGLGAADMLTGFLYFGSPGPRRPEAQRARAEDLVEEWTGPAGG